MGEGGGKGGKGGGENSRHFPVGAKSHCLPSKHLSPKACSGNMVLIEQSQFEN